MYYIDGDIVDVETYVEFLERIIIYAKEVIEGKYDNIKEHKILPIEAVVKDIERNRERRKMLK
ncbi:MAG: hypothetical protein V1892_03660 [bacterium]